LTRAASGTKDAPELRTRAIKAAATVPNPTVGEP
jgi:hypothetical protein